MIALLKKYWVSILFVTAIFILCFMNTAPLPSPPVQNIDKYVHSLLFLGLSGVIFFDNTSYLRKAISNVRIFLSSFLFPVLLGGVIEIMQTFLTSTRSGDWMDFLFDGIGAFLGMVISWLINRKLF
jgi:VanZ family protein